MASRIYFYNLPVELLSLILDYLSLQDILNLSEDPDFPLGAVRRHHIDNVGQGANILHSIAELGWTHIPQIRKFIQILDKWETLHWNLTPLAMAARNKHYELCRVFIEAGAHVNPAKGTSPLWAAASVPGNDDVIALLLQHGADVSWIGPSGIPVILHAVEHAVVETVLTLLSYGADAEYDSTTYGSLLHHATDPVVASVLIENGADVNSEHHSLGTPLMQAAKYRVAEVVDVLLKAGAEVDCYDGDGASALTIAIKNSHPEIVRKLIHAGCEYNDSLTDQLDPPLLLAVASGNENIVKILLEEGVDVDMENGKGESPLHLAARQQLPSLFEQLMDAGADVEVEDNDGRTPLFKAIYTQDEEILGLLLYAEADVSHVDHKGMDPILILSAGSESALCDIVEYFKRYGIDWLTECDYFIHEDDENLDSNFSMLNILFDNSTTDISKAKFQGIGVLHFAAWRNDADLVQLLLEHGADASYKDPGGNTPAAWAALMENDEIEELLRKAEADRERA